jgi:hypothetical protein
MIVETSIAAVASVVAGIAVNFLSVFLKKHVSEHKKSISIKLSSGLVKKLEDQDMLSSEAIEAAIREVLAAAESGKPNNGMHSDGDSADAPPRR